jgi:hypothetical protein
MWPERLHGLYKARHLSVSWDKPFQPKTFQPISFETHSNVILQLAPNSSKIFVSLSFPHKRLTFNNIPHYGYYLDNTSQFRNLQ